MAEVTYEKTGPVTGRIQLAFSKEELSKHLNEELKKESKRVSIKGFRKGKVPMSALRKLMGNQVFGPMLDRTIQEELFGYIEEHDIKLIFSPVPDEEEKVEMISATNIKDLKLSYDLGLEPDFELQLPEQAFTKYVLDTNKEFIDEQVESLRKQRGTTEDVEEGTIGENDILKVTIQEVDGPISNETSLYVDSLSDTVKEQLLEQPIGTSITVEDLTTVEKEGTEASVRKYLLELDSEKDESDNDNEPEDVEIDTVDDFDEAERHEHAVDLKGKSFTITVNKVARLTPAELNEEFFIQFDPQGEVSNEEQLRERLAENASEGFNGQGVSMANFEIQRALVEGNDFEVPTELMRKLSKKEQDSDTEFALFERSVRWMLIRNKIAEQKEIELQYEDVRAEALESLLRMLGGQRPDFLTDEFLDNYIQNMLKDDKQREEMSSNALEKKIMAAVREDVTLEDKPLSVEEFNATIKAFNEANTPAGEEEE
ncbi:Trigger factor [Neolewinella maritima]|uniref:Trigger factor n=1 Tax=Neolewinella maritima TaxID=1383882 RepID=A0ABM9B264_9BACT|nr:trigger factor [Neolewinella maritima]CAH1001210.1 Trigger factor [Neolewinella maritima]